VVACSSRLHYPDSGGFSLQIADPNGQLNDTGRIDLLRQSVAEFQHRFPNSHSKSQPMWNHSFSRLRAREPSGSMASNYFKAFVAVFFTSLYLQAVRELR
jgi:hypothetical protein